MQVTATVNVVFFAHLALFWLFVQQVFAIERSEYFGCFETDTISGRVFARELHSWK